MLSKQIKLNWLDLRGSCLSVLERLCLEEVLLRHDNRSWALVGNHKPLPHCYLSNGVSSKKNNSCIIVMGIGGKPKDLLNLDLVRKDDITIVKRFSGGGTVVLDHNSIWTTFIGRKSDFPEVEAFPRHIMAWTANEIFGPLFAKLKQKVVLSPAYDKDSLNANIPDFELLENDYILGKKKMGGNAQSIVKDGWLHHTSFLWDYESKNMGYLSLPAKRPDYRGNRAHDEFLVKLANVYSPQVQLDDFFDAIRSVNEAKFDLREMKLNDAVAIVDDKFGGMQQWFDGKCRTRILELPTSNIDGEIM
mmetsp:Transcript_1239/g.1586  ORF Transcript_1239/g.1586 Transcript_1239/m.1586 type:complete len:304 (+) Transcript_1239:80-991(+)